MTFIGDISIERRILPFLHIITKTIIDRQKLKKHNRPTNKSKVTEMVSRLLIDVIVLECDFSKFLHIILKTIIDRYINLKQQKCSTAQSTTNKPSWPKLSVNLLWE